MCFPTFLPILRLRWPVKIQCTDRSKTHGEINFLHLHFIEPMFFEQLKAFVYFLRSLKIVGVKNFRFRSKKCAVPKALANLLSEAPRALYNVLLEAPRALENVLLEAPRALGNVLWGAPRAL